MNSNGSTPAYVAATASRLRRAAGELHDWAGSPDAVLSLPVTLAHLEDALDQIAESVLLMARSVDSGRGANGSVAEHNAPAAEARALDHQLQTIATSLIDARDACPATCEWARRFLAVSAADAPHAADASTSRTGPRWVNASDLAPRPRRRAASTAPASRARHPRRQARATPSP